MASNDVMAACACGKVELSATGAPIAAAICYCNDCQAGGHMIEALPDAPKVLNDDGGSDYILFRKDRARATKAETSVGAPPWRGPERVASPAVRQAHRLAPVEAAKLPRISGSTATSPARFCALRARK